MNPIEVLENNHQLVIKTVEDLPESAWEVPGVCGEWSVKDVIAHLAAYELALIDMLKTFQGEQPSPYVLRMIDNFEAFNADTMKSRRYGTAQQVLNDYQEAQIQSSSLLEQIPLEKVEQKGTMPWYRPERSLADAIYNLSQHARAHCEEIARWREKEQDAH